MSGHFLLTTFGSLGDLHPYIAVGLGLQSRGHRVTIGTSEGYRAKVEATGLGFRPIQPDLAGLMKDPERLAKAYHPRTGTEYIFKEIFLPAVEHSVGETIDAARDVDVLVSHLGAFGTPTVAEVLGKPWVSVVLQPAPLFSIYDPPKVAGMPAYDLMKHLPSAGWKVLHGIMRSVARRWGAPVNRARRRYGLSAQRNPVLDDMFSPFGTQAWFSKVLAKPQRDWPKGVEVLGFPVYDKSDAGSGLDAGLARFLDAGPAPVVFTLGSSAVFAAGSFYQESFLAAKKMGIRAVLLTGGDARNHPGEEVPENIYLADYAPYSELFPRAAAVVHQGGVGTTAQALLAGKPSLFVPYSHDQPDNAIRVSRIGAARTLARHRYRADRVVQELTPLLGEAVYLESARQAAHEMSSEDGVSAACEGMERLLHGGTIGGLGAEE